MPIWKAALEKGKLLERVGHKAAGLRLLRDMVAGLPGNMKSQSLNPPSRRRPLRSNASISTTLPSRKSVPPSVEKVDDPVETLRRGEAAYQRHKKTWDRTYAGKFIAIHQDRVVAADFDKTRLLEQLVEQQQKKGRFRAYIVHVGAPLVQVRGPHPSQRGRKTSLHQEKPPSKKSR